MNFLPMIAIGHLYEAPTKRCSESKLRRAVQYPVATITLHGPDSKHSTTATVAITTREHAEPIVERWLMEDVTNRLKASQEVRALLRMYDVRTVAAWDRNIGCPHMAGLDYPVGSHCPYCPYWRGKQ